MRAAEAAVRLRVAGIEFAEDESGGIRCRARPGAMTDELRALVKEHRDALLAHLRGRRTAYVATSEAVETARGSCAPAVVLAQLLGMPSGEFGDLCRALIGRPGPSSSEEDAAVFAEIVRRYRRAT